MKIIKKGNPYRKHKCSMCKTIFAYHKELKNKDKWLEKSLKEVIKDVIKFKSI